MVGGNSNKTDIIPDSDRQAYKKLRATSFEQEEL
jgi:hypothetical protein